MENVLPEDRRPLGPPIRDQGVGMRIDLFLGQSFRFCSRTSWQKRLARGEVYVNGIAVKMTRKLKAGDSITYLCPRSVEPEVDRELPCLWQEGPIMAIAKPSGLPMHEGGRYRLNTFSQIVRDTYGHEWAAVHRLDRETSGIVLCASNPEVRATLSQLFRRRLVKKTYMPLVMGIPSDDEWVNDQPIGELLPPRTILRTKKWVTPDGLPSYTSFTTLKRGKAHALIIARPKTGRTHQIRVHSAAKGFPLVGDVRYYPDEQIFIESVEKGKTERVLAAVLAERLCLHAFALSFNNPITGNEVSINAPLPASFQKAMDALL